MDNHETITKEINDFFQVVKQNTEEAAFNKIIDAYFGLTPEIDKLINWFTLGIGASVVLLISNIESILKYIYIKDFKISIFLGLTALFLGCIQKSLYFNISVSRKYYETGRDCGFEIGQEYHSKTREIEEKAKEINLDIQKQQIDGAIISEKFIKYYYPKFYQNRARKILLESLQTPERGMKRLFYYQAPLLWLFISSIVLYGFSLLWFIHIGV